MKPHSDGKWGAVLDHPLLTKSIFLMSLVGMAALLLVMGIYGFVCRVTKLLSAQ